VASYELIYSYATSIDQNESKASFEIVEKNDIKLFTIPINEGTVSILPTAPTIPEVKFINESSSERKMQIYFEPYLHETRENFIPINDFDLEEQQDAKMDHDGKMIFEISEQALTYEVFKINHKPESYSEFANSLFLDVENITPANSEIVEFSLTPNKKYYFTFRTRNEFNLVSNPTSIYEIELIQDSDESRIVSKTIKLHEEDIHKTHRSFGKFMKIYPSFEQAVITDLGEGSLLLQSEVDVDRFTLGFSEESIWGRKLKIRVRSKNTGKIIDFNVNFVLNKIQSEEDFA